MTEIKSEKSRVVLDIPRDLLAFEQLFPASAFSSNSCICLAKSPCKILAKPAATFESSSCLPSEYCNSPGSSVVSTFEIQA